MCILKKKVIGSDNVAILHVSIIIIVDKASCITCTQHNYSNQVEYVWYNQRDADFAHFIL